MQLSAYLEAQGLTHEAFAEKCMKADPPVKVDRSTITRLCADQIPSKQLMAAIAQVTDGEVTANDFYGIAA